MGIPLTVNGRLRMLEIEPDTPLLWALRDSLGLTGTKFGCGIGVCGACTVHVDGRAVRACSFPVSAARGAAITTIEGLAREGGLHAVQAAWIAHQVPQCGYCQSGMVMAVAALLAAEARPDDAAIDRAITNICRCGTLARVRRAIHALIGADADADADADTDVAAGTAADTAPNPNPNPNPNTER